MSEETMMYCTKCGQKVYLENAAYSCECYELPFAYVNMGVDFPDYWVDEEYRKAAHAYLDNETSTVVKRDLSDAEIEELGAQEAEKRGEK